MRDKHLVALLIFLLLVLDQSSKIWVKTHLGYGEEIPIFGTDWALIHFVENNGMAFGVLLGGKLGKLLLSLFRIGAVALLFAYLRRLIAAGGSRWFLIGLAGVLAGALGNIIDSVFYGVLFSKSSYLSGPATFLPEGGGYAPLLYGRVVDMLYFPIFYGTYPEWIPWLGGKVFLFFRPVFNVADVAIAGGVLVLLFGYYRSRRKSPDQLEAGTPSPPAA